MHSQLKHSMLNLLNKLHFFYAITLNKNDDVDKLSNGSCNLNEKMALVKKSRLVVLLTIATVIFISIQVLFFNSLKSVLTDSASNDIFLNRTIIIRQLVNRETRKQSQKVSQFKIPLDEDNQPELVNLLPFYNRLNHFNFTLYFIDEPAEIAKTSKSQFVAIESENRLTDKTLLKKYDADLTTDLKSFRGININKLYLYKPDANGYFKCLNSNVIIIFYYFY